MTATTKKDRMYARIQQHGENLKRVFLLPDDTDPIKLCKSLRRLENKAHRAAEDYCNGTIDSDRWEDVKEDVKMKLRKVLQYRTHVPVFINSDPRGYALKICEEYAAKFTIEKDWGGYGIICPDLSHD